MSTDVMTPVDTPDAPRRSRRRLLLAALAVLVLAGLGLGLGFGLTGGSSGPTEATPASASHSQKSAVPNRGPNTLVFLHVPADRAGTLEGQLARAHGVQGVTYYPRTQELDVFMSQNATEGQKAVARRAVTASG